MPNIGSRIKSAGGDLSLPQGDAESRSNAFELAHATMLQRGRLPQSRRRRTETVPDARTEAIRKT
ncbi:hypothetical protein [Paraburkholderia dipogonis]|uniref:hypothetical protein n=1 Tax=Paraburkholderia dipogonis TaxID=1211383 RepID=UPI0038BDAEC0